MRRGSREKTMCCEYVSLSVVNNFILFHQQQQENTSASVLATLVVSLNLATFDPDTH